MMEPVRVRLRTDRSPIVAYRTKLQQSRLIYHLPSGMWVLS